MLNSKNKYTKYKKSNKQIMVSVEQMINWLSNNKIDYKDHNSDQIRVCNPDGDTNYCMALSKTGAVIHDFRPNHQQYDGPFLKFVSKYKNISFREAIDEVCGNKLNYINFNQDYESEDEIENEIELPDGCKSLRDKVDTKLWFMNMSYLVHERGIDKEVIYKANIHYLGTTIYVPYYQYGMIVFYQSRRQMNKIFDFPSSSQTSKKAGDFLYGFDNVEPCSEVIIVESIYNALSIGDDAVSTGGAKLKDGQLKLLKTLNPHTVTLAYDNDEAGRKAVEKDFLLLNKNAKGDFCKNIFYCLPPLSRLPEEQEDWNDMKQKKVNIKDYITNNRRKLKILDVVEGIKYNFI